MIGDKVERDTIAAALASIANRVCIEHLSGLTQEPPLTARIGQALESESKYLNLFGRKITVLTQDYPDKGPGALERPAGADLYFGISVETAGGPISKGFLVQAKFQDSKEHVDKLKEQCRKMRRQTKDANVWFYGEGGIKTQPAWRIIKNPNPKLYRGSSLAEYLSDVLECTKGDVKLGIPTIGDRRESLENLLRELAIPQGISVKID
jgi:hypothetical protein